MINCFEHKEKSERPNFAAFDFETDGLGGALLAISYMIEGDEEPTYLSSPSMLQDLFVVMCENYQFTWYAHNAQYELLYFIERMKSHGDRLEIFNRSDRDIFMVKFHIPEYGDDAAVVIKDSLALYPSSLKQWAKSFAPDLLKLDFDFETTKFDPLNPVHIEYSKRDSETLLACLIAFDAALFENFNVHCGSTTAGTAMKAWLYTLGKNEKYYIHDIADDKIRSAYYGGLVFINDTNAQYGANTYDINSSYPHQMIAHGVPIGKPMTVNRLTDDLGVYDVTVEAPSGLIIPILPVRDGKVIQWPSGAFRTTVTDIELKFAIKHGYKILEIHSGLVWQQTAKPFTAFIKKCMAIRKKHKGTSFEILAKLMQNGLYGKFGARKIRKKLYKDIPPSQNDLEFLPWGDFFIREEEADSLKALPQWAVFITARARLLLLEHAYKAGAANVVYGDTDSITVKQGVVIETGSEYGQFKLEKPWLTFVARAPKVYSGILQIDKKAESGLPLYGFEMVGAVKGIPKKYWQSQDILSHVYLTGYAKIEYKSTERLVTSMRSGYVGERTKTRSVSQIGNSRSWRLMPDGTVRPKPIEQEEDLQESARDYG